MIKFKTIREVLEDFADKCQFSMTTPMEKPELVWTIDRKELTDQALSEIRELMPKKLGSPIGEIADIKEQIERILKETLTLEYADELNKRFPYVNLQDAPEKILSLISENYFSKEQMKEACLKCASKE